MVTTLMWMNWNAFALKALAMRQWLPQVEHQFA